jgi:hypothetical protein
MSLVGNLEQQAEMLEREAAAFRKLIEAARDLGEERVAAILAPLANGHTNGNGNGHPAPFVPGVVVVDETTDKAEGPRGREAIRLIVATRYGMWTLAQLREEMKRKGWFVSNKGVDVAVTRMCHKSEARRVSKGRYEFFDPEDRRLL